MHRAVRQMVDAYGPSTGEDYVNALREVLQSMALLGLWRSGFFEHAAFYGGTALRILHGLDRFSEDLDFTLLEPDPTFELGRWGRALTREMEGFGFSVRFYPRRRRPSGSRIESAFLKTNTVKHLIEIGAEDEVIRGMHPGRKLKIRLEVDTDPPGDFDTETRYLHLPIPFAVRTCSTMDMLAGKVHAVLCRPWKNRVKGRDWYDLAWYSFRHPRMRLAQLEARMRQSGDYIDRNPLTAGHLGEMLQTAVEELDIESARSEVLPFLQEPDSVRVWSRDFFSEVAGRIVPV